MKHGHSLHFRCFSYSLKLIVDRQTDLPIDRQTDRRKLSGIELLSQLKILRVFSNFSKFWEHFLIFYTFCRNDDTKCDGHRLLSLLHYFTLDYLARLGCQACQTYMTCKSGMSGRLCFNILSGLCCGNKFMVCFQAKGWQPFIPFWLQIRPGIIFEDFHHTQHPLTFLNQILFLYLNFLLNLLTYIVRYNC